MVFVTIANGTQSIKAYNDGFKLEKIENFVNSPYSDKELRDKLEQVLVDKLPSKSKYDKVKQLIKYGVYISNDNIYEAMGVAKTDMGSPRPDYAVFRLLMLNAEVDPKELFGGVLQSPNMYPDEDKFYIDDSLDMRDSDFDDAMKFAHFYTATGLFDKRIYRYLLSNRYNHEYANPNVANYLLKYIVHKVSYEEGMALLIKQFYMTDKNILLATIKNFSQHDTFFMNLFLLKYVDVYGSNTPRIYDLPQFKKKFIILSKKIANSYSLNFSVYNMYDILGNNKKYLTYKAKCNSWRSYHVNKLNTIYRVLKSFLDAGYKCNKDTVKVYNGLKKILASQNYVEDRCDIIESGYGYYRKNELQKVADLLGKHINTKQVVLVKIAQLNKSLQAMIDKGDERGALFYMKKGAIGNQKALIGAVEHKMDRVAKRMLEHSTFTFEPVKVLEKMYVSHNTKYLNKLLKSRKFSIKQVAEVVYVMAKNHDAKSVSSTLQTYPQASQIAMMKAYNNELYKSMKLIALYGGSTEKNLLKKYEHKLEVAREKSEKRAKLEAETKHKQQEALQRAYRSKKHIGEQVCNDGTTSFILSITIKGYVESINGDSIRIRISDTEGTTPNYHGVALHQNTIIWDKYYNWRACR